jgi:hypothetical protein
MRLNVGVKFIHHMGAQAPIGFTILTANRFPIQGLGGKTEFAGTANENLVRIL